MEINDCLISDDFERLAICVNVKKYIDEELIDRFQQLLVQDEESQQEFLQEQFKDFIARIYHIFRLSNNIEIVLSLKDGELPHLKMNVKAAYEIEGSMVKLDRDLLRAVKQLVEYVEENRTA